MIYFIWDDVIQLKSKFEIDDFITKKRGYDGTDSELIADIIKKNFQVLST